MSEYKILVTSIGGDLGKAVCKSLRYSKYPIKILGTDCRDYIPYPLFCDNFQVVPKADSIEYFDALKRIVNVNSIDLIYICSEAELLYICDNLKFISADILNRLAIIPMEAINICRDKFKTAQFLKNNLFPYPYSIEYNSSLLKEQLVKLLKFPFIIKKKSDCGSKHFRIIQSNVELNEIKDFDDDYMFQEYIPGIEYTNAVYRDIYTKETYVITLERKLKDGMSDEVKVIFDKEIEKLCVEVAEKLNITGSINIQLRKETRSLPVIFEINPRFSSTAFMRANFGFNDVIFTFENMVLKRSIRTPYIRPGEAFRYITEYYKFN